MLYTVQTDRDMETTCNALQEAVARHKFGVLHVHDLKQTMERKGVDFEHPCRIFEVCNPHQAKRVLDRNLSMSTTLPCRISVYECDGQVTLATIRPTMQLQMLDAGDLAPVAQDVEDAILAIMNEAAGT